MILENIYSLALEQRGYETTLASDGEECVKAYRQKSPLEEQQHSRHCHQEKGSSSTSSSSSSSSTFDVVILDYRMPKKGGMQVAKEILELNPEQRIIFASAYVKETLRDSVKELKREVELVQKPFSMSALIDRLEDKEA